MSNAKEWARNNTIEGAIIHGRKKPAPFTGVAPKDLVFEELTVGNTQVVGPDGTVRPQYQLDFTSVLPEFRNELNNINLDTRALEALRSKALQSGPSAWLTMQQQILDNKLADMRDSAVDQQGSANADRLSQMAMTGGLSGGATERANRIAGNEFNRARQQIARYGATASNELAAKDEEMRNQQLAQLQGLEIQSLQPQMAKSEMLLNQLGREQGLGMQASQYNIGTALDELGQKRAFDLEQYKQKMQQYAADRTAHAQENSGGGGGKGGGK